ncbi:MAG TPA: histidine--tRNA ligase [Candidatus Paceibacterota bacterium]
MKRIDPETAKGVEDYLPAQATLKKNLIQTISAVCERHGFEYLETPILENITTLKTAESDFRIFNALTGEDDAWDTGLRFDLTVPLARVVAMHWNDLSKPFKRYQVGEVFRGEKPQKGRLRQFTQFDCDIVGTQNKDADVSLLLLARNVFDELKLGQKATLHINSKEYFYALQDVLKISDETLEELVKLFDKKAKISAEECEQSLVALITDSAGQEVCRKILNHTPSEDFETMLSYLSSNTLVNIYDNGGRLEKLRDEFAALEDVLSNNEASTSFVFNPTIARGFGYYTGMVCEVIIDGFNFSVLGGGRYDKLTERFSPQNFPAVGISFGVDRILIVLNELGLTLTPIQKTHVVVGYINESARAYAFSVLTGLDAYKDSIASEMYIGDQIDARSILMYALAKQATHMVVVGEDEMENSNVTVKNLAAKEQTTIPVDVLESYLRG